MARWTVESMICGYHEYISKLSLESELDLLKYCNIHILTLILNETIKAQLRASYYKTGKLAKKVDELLRFAKFTKVFSPTKFFTVR